MSQNFTALKYLVSISKGKKPQFEFDDFADGLIPYLSMDYLRGKNCNPIYVDEIKDNIVKVEDNDLLILWDGSKAGEIVYGKEGALSSTMAKIEITSGKVSKDYLTYFLIQSEPYIQSNTIGMGIPHVNGDELRNLQIYLPSLSEQSQIADFLDRKTAQIDEIIAKKEKMLTLLDEKKKAVINEAVTKGLNPNAKMKDSGIEWIGEIPENWTQTKLKYIGECKGRIGFRGYSVDDLVFDDNEEKSIVLGGTNIMRDGTISYHKLTFLSLEKYYESPEIMLEGGEILITKVGAGVGENAIYKKIHEKVTINPNVMLYKPFDRRMSDYINYYIFSENVKSHILMESGKSGAQPAINQSFIQDLPIFLPSIAEQEIISEFIMKNIEESKLLSDKISHQIKLLKEYRQSLISEAVTGKIDVKKL